MAYWFACQHEHRVRTLCIKCFQRCRSLDVSNCPHSRTKNRFPQGYPNLCVYPMLLYSKRTGFTVYLTYSDISLYMYIDQCEINVELPYLWNIVVLLPKKGFFERLWRSLSSPFKNSKRRTQTTSKSLKNRFWGKRTTIYTGKVIQLYLTLIYENENENALI